MAATPDQLFQNNINLYDTNADAFERDAMRYDYAEVIDGSNWAKAFPYQLAVLRANEWTDTDTQKTVVTYKVHEGLIFTLPINPEQLTNRMPIAINVAATLGGVVEQHGGAPFRFIDFTGTFGVLANRATAGSLQPAALGGIAGGIIKGLNSVRTSATSLGGGAKYTANLESAPEGKLADPTRSGYYQFRALQRFLESYVDIKKTSVGRSLRLALFIWKEEAAYLVTPLSFDVTRSAETSPFEYRYSLRLQSWKRVNMARIGLNGHAEAMSFPSVSNSSAFNMAQVYTAVSDATKVARAVTNTLKGVRADVDQVVDTLRQVALFAAATGGIVRTAASLPRAIRNDMAAAAQESWDIVKRSFDNLDPNVKRRVDIIDQEVRRAASTQSPTVSPTLQAALQDNDLTDFHDLIKPDSLNMNSSVRSALNEHMAETLTMTSDNFKAIADTIFGVVADFADLVGLGDPSYDTVVGRTPKAQVREATLDDFRSAHTLATAGNAILSLVTNTPTRKTLTTVEYVAGLANANGIEMRVPRSKFAVPFPYGGSLERLSQQYLHDASRWMEIAELNDLKAPYIDEVGSSQVLPTNGSGNTINMTDASELVLGQFVRVSSSAVLEEKRKVVGLSRLSDIQWRVTLDGANDLSKLKVSQGAVVKWFSVGTVNSSQVIYIPSDSAANADIVKYVPQEDDFNRVLALGDVDGMLDEQGDLVITPDGDWPLVTGYAYLVQWARVALNTRKHSLPLHPNFGIDVGLGDSAADTSAADILKSINSTIQQNASFTGALSASVVRAGPVTKVGVEFGVRGVDAVLPLTFDVMR